MAAVLAGMTIVMPQQTSAKTVQEKLQHQEAMAIISHAISTWQNFMRDPDMSGFRAHVKGGKGALIFPRLMKGAFVVGAEGGNGVLLVRHDRTGNWSEPAFYEISSASFGLQAGMETSEAIPEIPLFPVYSEFDFNIRCEQFPIRVHSEASSARLKRWRC